MTAINSVSSAHYGQQNGSSVTVQSGDTLSAIAARNGISLQALLDANPHITDPNTIHSGQTVSLPGGGQADAAGQSSGTTGAQAASAPSNGGAQPASMSLSEAGLNHIKNKEGLVTTAYQDPGGVWTIGYGHTGPDVTPGQTISEEEATRLLNQDTAWAQDAVRNNVKVPLTQGQFDALTSFTYNVGAGAFQNSTLLEKLNAGDYAGAQAEFGEWTSAGGTPLPGLINRRAEEAEMFGGKAPEGGAEAAPPQTGDSPAPAENPASGQAGGSYTVKRGDTLWDIAKTHGVSLQSLIAANPQIANPDLIYPDQQINLPNGATAGSGAGAGGTGGADGTGTAGGAKGTGGVVPAGNGQSANTVSIAESFLDRNASDLKGSGELPMDGSIPSDICCANFVSAVLQKNGLLSADEHTNAVVELDSILRNKGWQPVDMANAKPGDVVIMQRNGVSHTEIVAKNENGKITLIGSNNVNADGTQRISYDDSDWWHNHVACILTPPN